MDILRGAGEALLMIGVVFLIIVVLAALFMIVLNLATGIDDRIQE